MKPREESLNHHMGYIHFHERMIPMIKTFNMSAFTTNPALHAVYESIGYDVFHTDELQQLYKNGVIENPVVFSNSASKFLPDVHHSFDSIR